MTTAEHHGMPRENWEVSFGSGMPKAYKLCSTEYQCSVILRPMTICAFTAPPRGNEMLATARCVAERFVLSPDERPTDSRPRWSSPVTSSSCNTSLVPGAHTHVQVSDAGFCTSNFGSLSTCRPRCKLRALRWLAVCGLDATSLPICELVLQELLDVSEVLRSMSQQPQQAVRSRG